MKKLLILTSVCLSACTIGANFQRPSVATPEHWQEQQKAGPLSTIDPQWWQAFGSTELNRLITETLHFNNDLAAAQQRIAQARAQAKIAGANLWPSVGLQGNLSDSHNDNGDSLRAAGQFSVAYEVDLWGANRARSDAGAARFTSSVFARDALQLTLMASVSQAYFNVLAFAELKRISQDFLQNLQQVLVIVEARYRAGAVSELDVLQQQTEVASARANLDFLQQQYTLAENVLSILQGHPPQPRAFQNETLFAIRLPEVIASQPVTLLERRPDIRQAEMELKAANADITVAKAAFYPKLQLNLDTMIATPQPAGVALALLSSLSQPLFQGGRLEGGLENATARNAELIENYRKTILTAFKEVEDATAIRKNSTRRFEALSEGVAKAKQAYELSLERYRHGAIDYQTLLITQRSLLSAENSQIQARLDVMQALVNLYRALGGGWSAGKG